MVVTLLPSNKHAILSLLITQLDVTTQRWPFPLRLPGRELPLLSDGTFLASAAGIAVVNLTLSSSQGPGHGPRAQGFTQSSYFIPAFTLGSRCDYAPFRDEETESEEFSKPLGVTQLVGGKARTQTHTPGHPSTKPVLLTLVPHCP